ncbi:hypothetical protein FZO89_00595 [Luteimonas viscosa]|uniref:Uncharacterized protein n=1 Tax=Luteimonas viscosa TaxID=1132694 RepID=A0A5D4XLR0_9GAMM|nr:hypothetical protein [Luteimonas viscosa]TYT24895.1 hypothetical protein FZO89_00595 [Luteimonas viscosa]
MGVLACVLGGAMSALAWSLPDGAIPQAPHGALVAVGLTAALLGLVFAVLAHRTARAGSRLVRGIGELARWRVDAADWQAFVEAERAAPTDAAGRRNELSLPAHVPAEGVGIIVGEDAIDIGGSIHLLPRHGAPEVLEAEMRAAGAGPAVAELHLRHPPSRGRNGRLNPPLHSRLTFPVAPGAWRDARRAIGRYSLGRPGKASLVHGPGDGSDPEDLSRCGRCRYCTHRYASTCPECGGGMISRRWIRRLGAVLVVLGAVLAVGMTVLLARLAPMLANPGVEIERMRFSGSPAQAVLVWAVLGAVWVFGTTITAQGAFQMATGRRDLRVLLALAGIATLACGAMGVVLSLRDGGQS